MLSLCSGKGEPMDLNSVFEAVGGYKAGTVDDERLAYYEEKRLSWLRILLRNVYRQFHELSYRGSR